MPVFPLRFKPKQSYHEVPRAFGDGREKGLRKHAGIDLYAPAGTEILAIGQGIVVRPAYAFYCGTDAIEIQHGFGIVRYCEIAADNHLKDGELVEEGQVIAHVGKLQGITIASDMLHLEMYSNPPGISGPLSDFHHPPYQRRKDLMDPTAFLDSLALFQA